MKYENRDELIVKAKELRESGLSYRKIADKLGVKSENTVRLWLDSDARERERAQSKLHYIDNKEKIDKKNREYYAAHREKCKAQSKEWYETHKEQHRKNGDAWARENPDRVKEMNARYRERNRDKVNERSRLWASSHKDQCAKNMRQWRAANPEIVKYWRTVAQAAKTAVKQPGTLVPAGRVKYLCSADWLWCILPCGRPIAYGQPKFEMVTMPWGDESMELTALHGGQKPKAGQLWPRRQLSYLILVENITQAIAATVMRDAIVRAEAAGLETILTCHDEIVCVGSDDKLLHEVMMVVPDWATGLPIDAETTKANRYGK